MDRYVAPTNQFTTPRGIVTSSAPGLAALVELGDGGWAADSAFVPGSGEGGGGWFGGWFSGGWFGEWSGGGGGSPATPDAGLVLLGLEAGGGGGWFGGWNGHNWFGGWHGGGSAPVEGGDGYAADDSITAGLPIVVLGPNVFTY